MALNKYFYFPPNQNWNVISGIFAYVKNQSIVLLGNDYYLLEGFRALFLI
jgi:hypothetical protein